MVYTHLFVTKKVSGLCTLGVLVFVRVGVETSDRLLIVSLNAEV